MRKKAKWYKHSFDAARLSAVAIILASAVAKIAAQGSRSATPPAAPETLAIQTGGFSSGSSFSAATTDAGGPRDSTVRKPAPSDRIRRITLEQVKQTADPAASPLLARLGQLSIEAAKQHRLGVQADYFPKFGAFFTNLHFTEPLGTVVRRRRGNQDLLDIQVLGQNQTSAVLTFTQPITPLFQVRQAVRIARADERIARAKAGAPVAKAAREAELEETYFKLLIAQRQLTSAEWKLRGSENRPLFAGTPIQLIHTSSPEPVSFEAKMAFEAAASKLRELTTSLNRAMGWPSDTELELVLPDPLVENISLEEVADKSVAPNPDVVEAEQTVVKARAALTLSKLEYVPKVAALGGYLFQNVIPSVPSNVGYGGVIATYNLFDFGKRERAVKEARAQLGMAELALQLTKAKVAANLKKSYFELERSRHLSKVAQKMGSSAAVLMKVSSSPESIEVKAARAEVELEMLEADLAHRQAFAQLKTMLGSQR
jgi:outer membrane protein TolC